VSPQRAADAVTVGVIGAGFGKAVHVPAFRADSRCVVIAIAASKAESARRAAEELGIERSSGDWRTIVDDPGIAAIAIALPPALQVQVARHAIGKGKHVFLEKPVATSAAEAESLLSAAEKARVVHAIDFEFPEIPAWRTTRAMLADIGDLRNVVVQWQFETYTIRSRADSWKVKPSEGGGTLSNFVSHVFYNLEWLVGPIARLSARLADSGGVSEVLVDMMLQFKSGVPGSIAIAANAIGGPGHVVQLFGEHGSLTLRNPGPKYCDGFELTHGTRERVSMVPVEGLLKDRIDAVARVAHRFVDAILNGGSIEPNLRHGARVQRLLDAARDSHNRQAWVEV